MGTILVSETMRNLVEADIVHKMGIKLSGNRNTEWMSSRT